MKTLTFRALSVLAAVLMTACGGGNDGPAAETSATTTTTLATTETVATTTTTTVTATSFADKYVGTWSQGCGGFGPGGIGSDKGSFTVTKTSDTTLSFSFTDTTYASNNCSGTPTKTESGTGAVTFRGTTTIGTDTVDKVDIVQGNGPINKELLAIKNGQLFSSRDNAPKDSEGYPTALDSTGATKQ